MRRRLRIPFCLRAGSCGRQAGPVSKRLLADAGELTKPPETEGESGVKEEIGAVVVALQPDARGSMYRVTVARGSGGPGADGRDGAQGGIGNSAVPGGADEVIVLNLHEDTVVAWRLVPGRHLTPGEWERLREAEAAEDAYRAALALLAARPRTRKETEAALRRKGFAPEAIAACLERLIRHGLIDDAAFAVRFAAQRVTGQHKGRRLIRQELLQRGVGRVETERALSGVSEEAEREAALELARKRVRQVKAKTALERRHKLLGMLLRRGFPQAVAREAVRVAMEEAGQGPEDALPWED